MLKALERFLKMETASGILLVIAAILAMSVVNSPLSIYYDMLLSIPVQVQIADFGIDKPLLLWVNDGLMAIFFLLVGLEIKRELLSKPKGEIAGQIILPVAAAIGGIIVPALIYVAFNAQGEGTLKGWAIPTATDIAFALGVLSLLGKRVPAALKLFLLTLAIIDDLGAIIIIALFYTNELSMTSLTIAGAGLLILFFFNRQGVTSLTPYILFGLIIWVAVLKSGVHATLAGVLLAFLIPNKPDAEHEHSPAERLEHDLHPSVAFIILPLFAFMNTGVSLEGLSLESLLHPIPLGIALGLFFGKQIGVMLFSYLVVQLRLTRLPEGIGWWHIYGAAILAGIGFTMSLFISSLAFHQQGDPNFAVNDRLGILLGSTLSAIYGYLLLKWVLSRSSSANKTKT